MESMWLALSSKRRSEFKVHSISWKRTVSCSFHHVLCPFVKMANVYCCIYSLLVPCQSLEYPSSSPPSGNARHQRVGTTHPSPDLPHPCYHTLRSCCLMPSSFRLHALRAAVGSTWEHKCLLKVQKAGNMLGVQQKGNERTIPSRMRDRKETPP